MQESDQFGLMMTANAKLKMLVTSHYVSRSGFVASYFTHSVATANLSSATSHYVSSLGL